MTAADQPRPATLYDAVHAALFSLADRLPGEPEPVLLAWGVDPLAEKVTEHVEASGFLTEDPVVAALGDLRGDLIAEQAVSLAYAQRGRVQGLKEAVDRIDEMLAARGAST